MQKLALEGGSFSGKTTLLKALELYNKDRYKAIEEFVVYAGGSENFPNYPPKNKKEALASLEFFLNLEYNRHIDIAKYRDEHCIVVMDRSAISLLGFIFVQKFLTGIDIFDEAKEIIRSNPEILPKFVIYLHATDAQIKERMIKSGRKVGKLFIDPEFNKQLRVFFDWLIDQNEYSIISVNTNKSMEELKKEVIFIADKIRVSN